MPFLVKKSEKKQPEVHSGCVKKDQPWENSIKHEKLLLFGLSAGPFGGKRAQIVHALEQISAASGQAVA